MFKLTAEIYKFKDTGFTGWIREIRGIVVQGDSPDEVREELIKSLSIKIAYDYGIDPPTFQEVSEEEIKKTQEARERYVIEGHNHTMDINLTVS